MAIEKGMGLKKGEKIKKLGVIEVVSVRSERLIDILKEPNACVREGFPEWTPQQFIAFLCKKTNAQPANKITRIEFKKVK